MEEICDHKLAIERFGALESRQIVAQEFETHSFDAIGLVETIGEKPVLFYFIFKKSSLVFILYIKYIFRVFTYFVDAIKFGTYMWLSIAVAAAESIESQAACRARIEDKGE